MKHLALIIMIALLAPIARAAPLAPGIDPSRTYALFVGCLEWQRKEDWESFEAGYRRDQMLVEHLKSRGIKGDHVIYLQDKETKLANIRAKLAEIIRRTHRGDTLIVYYCGHGFREDGAGYFANWDVGETKDTYWPTREIVRTIDRTFPGDRAILLADCCHSGQMVDDLIELAPRRIQYAALTASVAVESSTGNWTFSQAVYDALTGSPLVDKNRDGTITFQELADYAGQEMAVFEGQTNATGFVNGFDPNTVLSTTPTTKVSKHYGERVQVFDVGEWWSGRIIDFKNDQALVRWVSIGFDTAASDSWWPYKSCKPLKLVQYAVGKKVLVKWQGTWYTARVLEVNGALHKVHYDGYEADSDEWVGPGRIKLARKNSRK